MGTCLILPACGLVPRSVPQAPSSAMTKASSTRTTLREYVYHSHAHWAIWYRTWYRTRLHLYTKSYRPTSCRYSTRDYVLKFGNCRVARAQQDWCQYLVPSWLYPLQHRPRSRSTPPTPMHGRRAERKQYPSHNQRTPKHRTQRT